MGYCKECGKEYPNGAKFCNFCGTYIKPTDDMVYDGIVHKCAHCGGVLSSTDIICPICGYEIRGANSVESVKEFELLYRKAENVKSKVDLLQTFSIPNTVEDIKEFCTLAFSNVDANALRVFDEQSSEYKLSNAWFSKAKQAYNKAMQYLPDSADRMSIRERYNDLIDEINAARTIENKKQNRGYRKIIIGVIAVIVFVITIICLIVIPHKQKTRKLEELVASVEQSIEAGDYEEARIMANQIIYDSVATNARTVKWDNVRTELLNTIEEQQMKAERKVYIGEPHDNFIGKDYEIVVSQLKNKGFTNIQTKPLNDMVLGWTNAEGAVEEISIGGRTGFNSKTVFGLDDEIIITYHSYKHKSENKEK